MREDYILTFGLTPSALSVSTSIHAEMPKHKSLSSCAFLSIATKHPPNANASRARARFALCHTYSFLPVRSEAKTCLRASFASSDKNEFVSSGTLLGFAHPNPAWFDFISQFCIRVAKEKLFRCISRRNSFLLFHKPTQNKVRFLDKVYTIIKKCCSYAEIAK